MNFLSIRPLLLGPGALIAAVIAVGSTVPALAQSTVTQTLTPGSLIASVGNFVLPPLGYAQFDQSSTGTMTVTADDETGSGSGWNVTLLTSNFVYSGANVGTAIPAVDFTITGASPPTAFQGQVVDSTHGPMVPTLSPAGALNVARKTMQAQPNFGQGTYNQDIDVALTVPGQSRAGTYTGTLTTTISTAP